MSVNEFKAWLDGYIHSFTDGTPTKEQWDAIKEKVDLLFPSKVK